EEQAAEARERQGVTHAPGERARVVDRRVRRDLTNHTPHRRYEGERVARGPDQQRQANVGRLEVGEVDVGPRQRVGGTVAHVAEHPDDVRAVFTEVTNPNA